MGRPLKQIDVNLVEGLAHIGCTDTEIAVLCDCSVDTLTRRFADILRKGRESLKMRLRRAQIRAAENGNVTMLIFLGKQYLGQRDTIQIDVNELERQFEAEMAGIEAGRETSVPASTESETVN